MAHQTRGDRVAKKKKIDTRAIGLDVALDAARFLTGKENLHYGLWRDGLETCAANLGHAQEAYTAHLFKQLPAGKGLRILDIGGGAGETARKLCDLGHSVDIVIPSPLLAEHCRKNTDGRAIVHECTFEDFTGAGPFDLCLFSESFQYIDLATALDKSRDLLAPGGTILIADCFRTEDYSSANAKTAVGGGHRLTRFRDFLAQRGLTPVYEEDITKDVAPSVEIEQAFFNVLGNGVARVDEALAQGRPVLRWIIHRIFGLFFNARRRRRLAQRFLETTRTAENFQLYNRYMIVKLVP